MSVSRMLILLRVVAGICIPLNKKKYLYINIIVVKLFIKDQVIHLHYLPTPSETTQGEIYVYI